MIARPAASRPIPAAEKRFRATQFEWSEALVLNHLLSMLARRAPTINSQARFCGRKKSAAGLLAIVHIFEPKESNPKVTIVKGRESFRFQAKKRMRGYAI